MSQYDNSGFDTADETGEAQGPERYLQPGEELLIFSTEVQIKKFKFEAFLTDKRLFLVDLTKKTGSDCKGDTGGLHCGCLP